jgi:hypothetical protein
MPLRWWQAAVDFPLTRADASGPICPPLPFCFTASGISAVFFFVILDISRRCSQVLQSIGLSGGIQTSYVERLNLTIRHTVAALRRRTWALAHSVRTLRWRVALAAGYYNFCRPHFSLRVAIGGGRYRQRTPAMALGVVGHQWSVEEVITHPVY